MSSTEKKRKKNRVLSHLKCLGFTNRLALYIIIFLAVGLAGGFYLAIRSISGDYTGSLLCGLWCSHRLAQRAA